MTPTHLTGLDRARPDAARLHAVPMTWRGDRGNGSINPCGSTGLASATAVYTPNLPAGGFEQTIKRPARHLGTRST